MMKKGVKYISEIIFSVFLIFISYFVWNKIDVEAYERQITQYNLNDVQIEVENGFDELAYVSDSELVDNTVLYINNYQNKVYNIDILFVLSDINEELLDDLYLSIDDTKFLLKDIYVSNEMNDYYFLISNISLKEYEKINYNLKLLVNDDYDFSNWTNFSYNFLEEIKG